jgi:hypothetical protein
MTDRLSWALLRRRAPVEYIYRQVSVAAPGAAADWTITTPGGVGWKLLGSASQLVTSATVANRYPGIVISVAGAPVFRAYEPTAITASLTCLIGTGMVSGMGAIVGANAVANIPHDQLWLPPNSTIASNTLGLAASDQYSAITLYVCELISIAVPVNYEGALELQLDEPPELAIERAIGGTS